jgi:hypothetical protein
MKIAVDTNVLVRAITDDDERQVVRARALLGRVDVAQIPASVAVAGDDPLPAAAQHQGGWIMRKLEVVAEVACGRFGAHGTRAGRRLAVPASEANTARPADAKRPTDAKPHSPSALASVASA